MGVSVLLQVIQKMVETSTKTFALNLTISMGTKNHLHCWEEDKRSISFLSLLLPQKSS